MRFWKSKITMTITHLVDISEKEDEVRYKVKGTEVVKMSGKLIEDDYNEDVKNGVQRKIERVFSEPKKFQPNVIYILEGGKRAWTYVIDES